NVKLASHLSHGGTRGWRSAPVLGRSNGQKHERLRFQGPFRMLHIAAPEDGRTPGFRARHDRGSTNWLGYKSWIPSPEYSTFFSMHSLPTVLLKPGEADRILAGHPWIYHGSV